jgi:hypothetical protein
VRGGDIDLISTGCHIIAGRIAHRVGYSAAFLFLTAIAAAGLVLFLLAMPETRIQAETGAG